MKSKPGASMTLGGAATSVLDWREWLVCSRFGGRCVNTAVGGIAGQEHRLAAKTSQSCQKPSRRNLRLHLG
jgi:hypothetical protein